MALSLPHLHPVSHLHEGAGWVKSPGSTGVQVRTVVVVDNLHVVHAVGLKHTWGCVVRCRCTDKIRCQSSKIATLNLVAE